MGHIHSHDYRNGFRECHSTYRVTWDVDGQAEDVDLRKRHWRRKAAQDRCGANTVRGSRACYQACWEAARKLKAAGIQTPIETNS